MTDEPAVGVTDMPSTEPKEPAVSTGAYVGGATLLVNGLVLLGVPLSFELKGYLVLAITFFAPVVAGMIIRSKVFSPKTVEQIQTYWRLMLAEQARQLVAAQAETIAAKAVGPTIERTLPALFAALPAATVLPSPAAQPEPAAPQNGAQPAQEAPQGDARMMPAVPAPSAAYQRFMAEQEPVRRQGYYPDLQEPRGPNTAQPAGYYDYPSEELSERSGYRRHRRRDTPS